MAPLWKSNRFRTDNDAGGWRRPNRGDTSTVYTPKAFEVTDLAMLQAAMKQSELATLVTMTSNGIVATHLPLLLDETKGEYGTLTGHVSRANVQWRESIAGTEALIIFLGLDTYVSPTWYAAKQETGRVVPTWNYAAIHAYGHPAFFEDTERLRTVVTDLTNRHETSFPEPWKVTDAPAVYIDSQLKAIVGFEIPILRLEGKKKFNQNRSREDRAGVMTGLRELGEDRKTKVADLMQEIESQPGPTSG